MNQDFKHGKELNPFMLNYQSVLNVEKTNDDKLGDFLERISAFKEIKTLNEAKELAKNILPTENEINRFYVASAKVVVINKEDLLRISVINDKKITCYNFQ